MEEFNCPHCGRPIRAVPIQSDSLLGRALRPFAVGGGSAYDTLADRAASPLQETAGMATPPPFKRAERRTPARTPGKEPDVIVPLYRSLLTGLIVGLPISVGVALWREWPWWCVPAGTVATTAAVWTVLQIRGEQALWVVEKIFGADIDGDGHQGAPPPPKSIRFEIEDKSDEDRDTTYLLELPCPSPHYLRLFARAVTGGDQTFSERGAQACGYSPEMWRELRDEFVERGWARWRHPNEERQGVELLGKGKAILHAIAELDL